MNDLIKSALCSAVLSFSMQVAMAHPEGHHHAPCDHMGDSKMMQKHMEEHHKEATTKTPEGKEEIKASTPAASTKPVPKTGAKPSP